MRHKSRLKVNKQYFLDNVAELKQLAPQNKIIFMVKADAYGHGIFPLVRLAVSKANIDEVGVASLGEAIDLRNELRDLEFEIYVFSDLELDLKKYQQAYVEKRILPVISQLSDLKIILENPNFKYLPICLKINTGMNRLGIDESEWPEMMELLKSKKIKRIFHLMTHFASSEKGVEEDSHTYKQYQKFIAAKKILSQAGFEIENTSVANSGAIEQKFGLDETHIRPGLMLYGIAPRRLVGKNDSHWQGKNISRLETEIIHAREVKRGDKIGYGGATVPEDGVMTIFPLGYGDGILNFYRASKVTYSDKEGEIFGKINMDMTSVYFRKNHLESFEKGGVIHIWNHDPQTIYQLCHSLKVIPYEIFCSLSRRLPRIYE